MRKSALGLLTVVVPALLLVAAAEGEETCYLSTPAGARAMGVAGSMGPYSSRAACDSINQSYFQGNGTCSCTTVSTTPTSPDFSGSSTPSFQEIYNNIQFWQRAFGVSPEQIEQQRHQRRLEEEQRRVRDEQRRAMDRLEAQQRSAADEQRRAFETQKRALDAQTREIESAMNALKRQQWEMNMANARREADAAAQLEAEEQRKKFAEARDRINSMIRLVPELTVREKKGPFGTTEIAPVSATSPPPPKPGRAMTAVEAAQCASALLRKAADLSASAPEQAAYLSQQATDLMSGRIKYETVECALLPKVPPAGRPKPAKP